MMRVRPYRTIDDRIDGVVVTFVDITDLRRATEQVRASEEQYRALFETMSEGLLFAEVLTDASGAAVDVRYSGANPAAVAMVTPPPPVPAASARASRSSGRSPAGRRRW